MYQGDWKNDVEGTRQINSVTSGKGGPSNLILRLGCLSENFKVLGFEGSIK